MNSSVPVSYKDMPLAALAEIRSDAKVQEDMAVAYRRDIDKEIALRLKDCDEGTVSSTDGDFKVSVTYKVSRSVDTALLQEHWEQIGDNARNAFKWNAELNMKHFRALQELNAPDLATVQGFITTKPASPSVTVERIGG